LPGFLFHPEPVTDGTTAFGWYHPHADNPRHWRFYEQLESLSGATIRRLKEIRTQQELLQRQRTPTTHSTASALYLHARPEHAEVWQETRQLLEAAGFEVRPKAPVIPTKAGKAMNEARHARLKACKECDALLILRPESGSWIDHEIATTGHNERAEIAALFDKWLPCAVIDRVGDNLPIAQRFGISVVPATGLGWLLTLHSWLTAASSTPIDVAVSA
jgi:hypothetical protein